MHDKLVTLKLKTFSYSPNEDGLYRLGFWLNQVDGQLRATTFAHKLSPHREELIRGLGFVIEERIYEE